MPAKRLSPSSDSSDVVELPLKKTHRTHEENQERAYIAASRRADRDIEHRIRSALKASECRRKRTGRGLKITREAVMGDEQYESEDDDHASRRFSMPVSTSSLSNPYLQSSPTRAADRYAEVDALFAKHFPHIQLSSQWPRQQQPQQQPHRHSYPQAALRLQTQAQPGGYVPRFQQQQQQPQDTTVHVAVPTTTSNHATTTTTTTTTTSSSESPAPASAPARSSASPTLLTPPVSYPLPPASCDEGESEPGSMSPLALEARSRPGSADPPVELGLGLGLGMGLGLMNGGGGYLSSGGDVDPTTAAATAAAQGGGDERGSAAPLSIDFSSAAAVDPVWFASGGGGGGWHGRSLSLPSALEQFQFFSSAAFGTGDTTGMGQDAADSLIDPSILASANDGVEIGPGEPWADWINLDGDIPPPLGVEV